MDKIMNKEQCFKEFASVIQTQYDEMEAEINEVRDKYWQFALYSIGTCAVLIIGVMVMKFYFSYVIKYMVPFAILYLVYRIAKLLLLSREMLIMNKGLKNLKDAVINNVSQEALDRQLSTEEFIETAKALQICLENVNNNVEEVQKIYLNNVEMPFHTLEDYAKVLRWESFRVSDYIARNNLVGIMKYHRGEIRYVDYNVNDSVVTVAYLAGVNGL